MGIVDVQRLSPASTQPLSEVGKVSNQRMKPEPTSCVPTWCDRLGQSICRRVSRRICSRAPSKALLGTGRLALLVVELGRVDINLFQQPVDLGLYPILT